jgi:hypothetical protein
MLLTEEEILVVLNNVKNSVDTQKTDEEIESIIDFYIAFFPDCKIDHRLNKKIVELATVHEILSSLQQSPKDIGESQPNQSITYIDTGDIKMRMNKDENYDPYFSTTAQGQRLLTILRRCARSRIGIVTGSYC